MNIAHRIAVVAGLCFLGACSDSAPAALPAPRGEGVAVTTPAAVVTTAAAAADDVAAPPTVEGFAVPALSGLAPTPSPDGNLGSGCSSAGPAIEDGGKSAADGQWVAIINQRTPEIVIDLVCLAPDGTIGNTSDRHRANPTSAGLQVFGLATDGTSQPVDAPTWVATPADSALYWVAINGGLVTSVQQITPP